MRVMRPMKTLRFVRAFYHVRSSKLMGIYWWQGFDKPYLMSWTAQAGLALIAPFSGLSIRSMEYDLRWKLFVLTFFGTLSIVFFSWGMLYLPVSISVLIRVCACLPSAHKLKFFAHSPATTKQNP